jgi:4-amino-4-deoxy-L-arabinose transferase-like glycosyltransferase
MTMQAAGENIQPALSRRAGGDLGLLCLLLIIPMLVRLWFAAAIPLTEDEAYYRLWALAPALSYYDHPPMAAWMMAAGRWLVGDTALGLRLAGILATVVSTVALWRTAHLLIGRQFAIVAAAFATAIPLLSVGAIVITPDTPSVLFFVLGAWALAELNSSRNANWWLAVGLFAGLGLLSKYTNLFFGVTILVWLLMTRRNWHWFASWQLYAGGALAMAIFTPVIIWNIANDGASFNKQFGRLVDVDGFKIVWQLELWGALILLFGPVIFWLAVRGLISTVQRFKATGEPAASLLLALTAPIVIYFCLHALHGRVLPNWLAPAYPFFAILAAAGAAAISDAKVQQRAIWSAAGISAALSLLIYAHAVAPFYVATKAREPTHQLRGWQDFTAQVTKTAEQAGATYIATTSYGTTGHLAFYLDQRWPVLQLNDRIRYLHLPAPDSGMFTKPGIVVELTRRDPKAALSARFKDVEPLGSLTRNHQGIPLQTYVVYRVSNPIGDPLAQPSNIR